MKNLTITVADDVLEWARIEAARRGTSVSRMVGDFMAEMRQREDAYERAYLAWRSDERNWQATTLAPADVRLSLARNPPENRAVNADPVRSRGEKDHKKSAPASAAQSAPVPAPASTSASAPGRGQRGGTP